MDKNEDLAYYLALALGRKITAMRRDKNYTLIELSIQTGLDRNYLKKLEQGRANPSLEVLARVAEVLDCSLSKLVGELEKYLSEEEVLAEKAREADDNFQLGFRREKHKRWHG